MGDLTLWHALGLLGLYLALLLGLLAIPIGLGGNFILLGAALITALATRFETISWWMLLIIGAAVALGEIVETILGSLVAKKYGASRWGMLGAFAGGVLGAVPGTAILPVVGTVIGSFLGSAAGAVLFESIHRRNVRESMPAGWGAFLGRLAATFFKIGIGMAIAAWLVVRTWPR